MSLFQAPMRHGRERFLRGVVRCGLIAAAALTFVVLTPDMAGAQGGGGGPLTLSSNIGNANMAASNSVFDLTNKFLRDLANQSDTGRFAPGGFNPGGGGASEQRDPHWRFWSEGYGLWSRTGAQNVFTGDKRTSYGGIAGLGYTLAPGVNIGMSVDQGHTKINLPVVAQRATVDLTQIGLNGSIDSGPWTFSIAFIHGFGDIHTHRSDGGGPISASYGTKISGAVGEVSYYWSSGHWRVVPKIGIDGSHGHNDAFVESGGSLPVTATEQSTFRARAFAGVE
ncbi:MAG: autotransporter outer membrane beta-barrel domain-containing protein, partial [Rhizobiales bacterium]|nr:autotransporter outer membrane beta-barrel domain-containing protein [Hyphomicrobiales bacterium]